MRQGLVSSPKNKRDRSRRNKQQVLPGRLRLDNRRNFITGRVVSHWNRLPRKVDESSSLQGFKRCASVALGNMAGLAAVG